METPATGIHLLIVQLCNEWIPYQKFPPIESEYKCYWFSPTALCSPTPHFSQVLVSSWHFIPLHACSFQTSLHTTARKIPFTHHPPPWMKNHQQPSNWKREASLAWCSKLFLTRAQPFPLSSPRGPHLRPLLPLNHSTQGNSFQPLNICRRLTFSQALRIQCVNKETRPLHGGADRLWTSEHMYNDKLWTPGETRQTDHSTSIFSFSWQNDQKKMFKV